jgi:H+-translocating NAD(P) transhydrogenase subunit beta
MTGTEPAFGLGVDGVVIALCIVGLWLFRTPRGARYGNLAAALAMACAFALVLYRNAIVDPVFVAVALLAGAAAGYGVARAVSMLQIPTLVALQNGMGGLASLLVSLIELARGAQVLALMNTTSGVVGVALGALTFSGSMVAAAKLSNTMRQTPQRLPAHSLLVLITLCGMLLLGLGTLAAPAALRLYVLIAVIAFAALFGLLFSIRIGGADMPVLISFLNATTGLAAAFCGIVIENQLLIAFGAIVAASGSILTHAMCKAMNRPLLRVFVPHPASPEGTAAATRDNPVEAFALKTAPSAQTPTAAKHPLTEARRILEHAQTVIIVPGYGMALAQAQTQVAALADRMVAMGKSVRYAIHPVAGRMPGHMNVVLAEAGVEYDMLVEMDAINPQFSSTDLVLVVGACDVVNPAAIDSKGTPLSGMPILLAYKAKHVVCCNYDRLPGYSGVRNPLYDRSNTVMLAGDAKKTLGQLIEALVDDHRGERKEAGALAGDPLIDAAKVLVSAKTVVIVPGYGLALAQAQQKVAELAAILEKHGAGVKFAIHPVAGRMPGHMNVVLAEAEVDYDALVEMETINPEFSQTDVVLVFGACDVVNPAAIGTQGSPISGMPILLAHEAKSIIICNFDTKPGYSGVQNPLYQDKKAILLLGDAKKTAVDLIAVLISLLKSKYLEEP